MKKKASMGFVYASPEMMLNSDHTTVNDERYPFFHAINYGEDAAGNEAEETDSSMSFAYASPEMYQGLQGDDPFMDTVYDTPRWPSDSDHDRIDSDRDNSAADNEKVVEGKVSYCMYCGSRTSEESRFCVFCGQEKKEPDPDSTLMSCSNCNRNILVLASYCPYCGNKTWRAIKREQENEQKNELENELEPYMNNLYGSPSFIDVGKKSLLSRIGDLFKRR